MSGAAEKKHPKDVAGKLFDLMEQFAGYGFTSHTQRPTYCLAITPGMAQDTLPDCVYWSTADQKHPNRKMWSSTLSAGR